MSSEMSTDAIDIVIGLFAGRDAKLRLERKRTLKFFQSLPNTPIQASDLDANKQSWADEVGGSVTGLRESRRSFLRPWEEPNFGIQFRYRQARDSSRSTYSRSNATSRAFSQTLNTSASLSSSISSRGSNPMGPLNPTIDLCQARSPPSRKQSSTSTSASNSYESARNSPLRISSRSTGSSHPSLSLGSSTPPSSAPIEETACFQSSKSCLDLIDIECPLEGVETFTLDPVLDVYSVIVEIPSNSPAEPLGINGPQLTKTVTFAKFPKIFNLPSSGTLEPSADKEEDVLFIASLQKPYPSSERASQSQSFLHEQSSEKTSHAIPSLDLAKRQLDCAFPPEVLPSAIFSLAKRPVLDLARACAEGRRIDQKKAATSQHLAKEKDLAEQQERPRPKEEAERLGPISANKFPPPPTPRSEPNAADNSTEKCDVNTNSGRRDADPGVKSLTAERLVSCPRPDMLEIKSSLGLPNIRQLEAKVARDLQNARLFRQPTLQPQFLRTQANLGLDPGPWPPNDYMEAPRAKPASKKTEKKRLVAKRAAPVARARSTKRRDDSKGRIFSRGKNGERSTNNTVISVGKGKDPVEDDQGEDEWDPVWMVETNSPSARGL